MEEVQECVAFSLYFYDTLSEQIETARSWVVETTAPFTDGDLRPWCIKADKIHLLITTVYKGMATHLLFLLKDPPPYESSKVCNLFYQTIKKALWNCMPLFSDS